MKQIQLFSNKYKLHVFTYEINRTSKDLNLVSKETKKIFSCIAPLISVYKNSLLHENIIILNYS